MGKRKKKLTEKDLREIFKPDKYGFCQKHKVWFDTVLKVNKVIEEAGK